MTDARDPFERNPLNGWRVRLLTWVASFNLFWEKLWPQMLPLLAVCGLFLAVALFDFLPMLPLWLHISALVVFAVILSYSVWGLVRGDYHVGRLDARRRVEMDSGVAHRPLEALNDELILHRADAGEMWVLHKARMAALLSQLKVGLPSPGMARRDPFGFRAALLMILVIASAAGVGDARARLERALIPEQAAVKEVGLTISLWITPPAYTGLAPIFLENTATKQVVFAEAMTAPGTASQPTVTRVPVGSTFLAQLSLGDKQAAFLVGNREKPFKALDPIVPEAGASAEGVFVADDAAATVLTVSVDGHVVTSWPVRIEVDVAPEVEFTQPPKKQGRGLLRVEFEAKDDFGLANVDMIMLNPQGWPVPGGEKQLKVGLPVPNHRTTMVKGASSQDFTAHPWAGTAVELLLDATDLVGQKGTSDSIVIVLPERTFNHPVARAIIATRKKLNGIERKVVREVVSDIEQIAERPAHFYEDTVVFLALVIARSRLLHDASPKSVGAVQRLLWDAALRIEDGEFAIADRALEDAQRRVMEALRNHKMTKHQLDRLLDQLQKAMNEYTRALSKHLQREGLQGMPQATSTEVIESGDLQRMMDRTRELMQTGSIDAAKQMLTQLNQMLEALRQGARTAHQQRGPSQGREMLQNLRNLVKRQQELLELTFRSPRRHQSPMGQGQQRGQGQMGQKQDDLQADELASQQDELRRVLEKLALQMDEFLNNIPPAMGKADRAMRDAGQSLDRGDRAGAVPQQTEALENLRQTSEGLAEQLGRLMRSQQGMFTGRHGKRSSQNRDPFGRRRGDRASGKYNNGAVKIPDGQEILRSRRILDELRVRSGDRGRPALELEYIDRLLRQF